MTVIELTGLTRNTDLDHNLSTTVIGSPTGLCWFNGYWRISDFSDEIVYALDTDFAIVSAENITVLTNGSKMRGLTKTATHLLVLFEDQDADHYVEMYDTDNNFVMKFTLTGFPSNGGAGSICYDETNNILLVGVTGSSGGVGHIGAFAIPAIVTGTTPSTALISASSFDLTTDHRRPDAMVWYEGYAITVDSEDNRFYVYKLSDQSIVSYEEDDTNVGATQVNGLGLRDGSLYLVDRATDAIVGWDINSSTVDAPTGLSGTATSSTVSLTWDDPDDDTITGYKILRKTGSGSYSVIVSDTGSNAQSYADTTVVAGTTYTYTNSSCQR